LLKKARSVLVVGHQNSDPDAVCSAYAFIELAHRLNKRLKINFVSPDGISKLSKQILDAVPLEVLEEPDMADTDLIVTVDTNTLQQLGGLKQHVLESGRTIVMIDHHAPHPENAKTAMLVLCDEKSTSTCEMILDMYHELRLPLNEAVSQALMIGMLVETGHMTIGTKRTYKSAYALIEAGADPQSALAVTRSSMDESERIARVKSAQRVRLERVGNWLIALSQVGSYHASAARGLIALGAHLAIVAGERNDTLTLSFRSTREFAEGTGMHLGTNLATPIGEKMGGMGGGHSTAAGASVKGNVNEALKLSFQVVRDFLTHSSKPNTSVEPTAPASSQSRVITQN
jgi:nanoRNase/pAp phosphatase (c-di-AMP/oligoRNAs hydrolase)